MSFVLSNAREIASSENSPQTNGGLSATSHYVLLNLALTAMGTPP